MFEIEPTAREPLPLRNLAVQLAAACAALMGAGAAGSASTSPPPTISGSPPASVKVGSTYSFQPKASDPSRHALYLSIRNKPAWATFSIATGKLSGTPASTAVGTYANIVISLSDGRKSASLPGFNITVGRTQSPATTGSATLTWTAPATTITGAPLTTLSGYTIEYGTSAAALDRTVTISARSATHYTVQNLSAGTWYFAVRAVTSAGAESALSNVVSKWIP